MQNMLPGELRELMADVAHVKLQDFHLGRVLETIVTHLAHAHGLDPNVAPTKEEAETSEEASAEEEETAPKPVVKGKVR
jgi:hypothetical protein